MPWKSPDFRFRSLYQYLIYFNESCLIFIPTCLACNASYKLALPSLLSRRLKRSWRLFGWQISDLPFYSHSEVTASLKTSEIFGSIYFPNDGNSYYSLRNSFLSVSLEMSINRIRLNTFIYLSISSSNKNPTT